MWDQRDQQAKNWGENLLKGSTGSTGSELAKKTFERLNGINEINGIRVSEKTFARIRDQRDQS